MAGDADELPQDEELLVQGDAPDWLANIAPSSTPTPTVTDASALDFSALDTAGSSAEGEDWFAAGSPGALPAASLEPTDSTEDWFGSSGTVAQEPAAEAPGMGNLDWLSQPSASSQFQAQGTSEPTSSMELEDDWLASFEAPLSEPAASAPSDDSWLTQLGTSTLDTSPAENT